MIRRLTKLLGQAVERRLRDIALGVGVAAAVALFAAISMGFGAVAAYLHLRGLLGGAGAALIVCAAYGLMAILVGAVWAAARRRKARRARSAAAPAPAGPSPVDPVAVDPVAALLQSLAGAGAPQEQEVMAAAMRLGQEMSPAQLLALALIGGFIVGKKLNKK